MSNLMCGVMEKLNSYFLYQLNMSVSRKDYPILACCPQ